MAADEARTDFEEGARLALADLLNRVLDKGVVITGTVTIAVADVDLIQLGLNLYLTALEGHVRSRLESRSQVASDADIPLLPPRREG
jgi:gas vesicle structural protein